MVTFKFTPLRFFLLGLAFIMVLACGAPSAPRTMEVTKAPGTSTLPPTLVHLPVATIQPTFTDAPPTATALPPTSPPPATPLNAGAEMRDVIYCTMNGIPAKMDIAFPFVGNGPWPVVLYVHGGGWIAGSKLDPFGEADVPALRNAGYMTVAVSYRLAPQYPFPAMIQDVKCAVRYLRAHAEEYNLDPARIAARGASAGGHIVALLATADKSAGWDVGEYLEYSSRIQAVVDMSGPTSLADESALRLMDIIGSNLFGANETIDQAILILASPTTYVSVDDPPALIIHGDQDVVVNRRQSRLFYDALRAAGVPAELIVVENSNHEFEPVDGSVTNPTRAQITDLIIAFLDQVFEME